MLSLPVDSCYTSHVNKGNAYQFAIELARIAQDNNSENVVALDLRGISSVTDFVVIGTGTSDRQMRGVVDNMVEYGKKMGQQPYGLSGYDGGTWILLDYVDVVLHMFARHHRDYYDLELLWGDAQRLSWSRSESA